MWKKNNTRTENIPIDVLVGNLVYYTFDVCQTLLEVNNRSARILRLDESLTKEQIKALKEEVGMSDSAITTLARAKRNYQSILKDLDALAPYMGSRVPSGMYDYGTAMTNELIGVLLLYLAQTEGDAKATKEIINKMLKCKPLSPDILLAVKAQFDRSASLRERIKNREKDTEKAEGGKVVVNSGIVV